MEINEEEIQSRISSLEEAQELIYVARDLIDGAIHGTSEEAYYKAYGRYGIDQLLSDGNPYDYGIDNIIETLQIELANEKKEN